WAGNQGKSARWVTSRPGASPLDIATPWLRAPVFDTPAIMPAVRGPGNSVAWTAGAAGAPPHHHDGPLMHVLAIGTDPDLARPPELALGDALQRQLKYASILDDYQMIVRTVGGRPFRLRPAPNFGILASGSRHRATFPFDAFAQGLRLDRQHRFDLVSTED